MSFSDLSVLARVSSIWFECAIPLLYRKVRLDQALTPLGEADLWTFVHFPGDKDFERFLKYAPHVQVLTVEPPAPATIKAVPMRVFEGVAYPFPNIRSINLSYMDYFSCNHKELSECLLSPGIEQLHLYIPNHDDFQYVCQLAITRLPALRFFRLNGSYNTITASGVSSIAKLLTCFANTLTLVYIPLSCNIAPIAECLSKMPNLRNLALGRVGAKALGSDWPATRPNRTEKNEDRRGGFTSLRSFSFEGPPKSLYATFLKPHNLASMITFSWSVKLTPVDVSILTSTITTTCPCLRRLTLDGNDREQMFEQPWLKVPWASIVPISRCKELIGLSLKHMHIFVSLEELTEFLKSRTTWTYLDLFTSDPLHLHDMLLYAKYCLQLKHLGIFVDDRLGSFTQDVPRDIPIFHVLNSIDFAYSHIEKSNAKHLARFLFDISKNPLHLSHSRQFSDQVKIHDVSRSLVCLHTIETYRTGKPMSSDVDGFMSDGEDEESEVTVEVFEAETASEEGEEAWSDLSEDHPSGDSEEDSGSMGFQSEEEDE